jgi:chemotaxis protein CheZ
MDRTSLEYNELKIILRDLGRFIKHGRKSLANTNPEEIVDKYIPDSTSQLEAIISGAENASNEIMDSCDAIEKAAEALDPAQKEAILAETAKIYASCGFQDITGQRARKVMSYLAQVEERTLMLVKHLKDYFDRDGKLVEEVQALGKMEGSDAEITPFEEDPLLSGPQLEGQGLSQVDVDALLDDF